MIKPFTLEDGATIYVEVQETTLPAIQPTPSNLPDDLPEGAEPTGIIDDIVIGSKLLKETITGTAQSVFNSLKDLQPDEWSVEINIGMKAEDMKVIPVLVTGSGEGSLKITATWKKHPAS
ncbi:MAG: hypothetical protein HZT40_23085 [Candidatus Thiothrix singaporensis]|uniref:Trypsin-co-occurring domain-containing protein n=1 Tax=Candidatus Thiothrix singaporensis TaxID=2799669 RepID=A0A7L6AMK5_9GAMM|nr:MAG: hypothetical protein HZT40_00080 [Candidatus Thiothrix singaporensis]QLQ34026.1 MAG: hypothetical protein HZT40_23085 [Candidatus Thiothrix singaporensis]